MIEVSDDLLFGLHQLAKGQDGNYIIIVWFQKKLSANDKCSSSPHEVIDRPDHSSQFKVPLFFLNSGDSLVFPLNKEELLLRKDEGEKANGLT